MHGLLNAQLRYIIYISLYILTCEQALHWIIRICSRMAPGQKIRDLTERKSLFAQHLCTHLGFKVLWFVGILNIFCDLHAVEYEGRDGSFQL